MIIILLAMVLNHGSMSFPPSRQYYCKQQQQSGNMTGACRYLSQTSSASIFYQWMEYSINIKNYQSELSLQQTIPNNNLCSANNQSLKAVNEPRNDWFATKIYLTETDRKVEITWDMTAAHNPSYFEYYLTKPGFDVSRDQITWDKVYLVYVENKGDNTTGQNNKYEITIPKGRCGRMVIFFRWQRMDAAGEGFYGCSDIEVVQDNCQDKLIPFEQEQSEQLFQNFQQGQSYFGGDCVYHDNDNWIAKWWTNSAPKTESYGAWSAYNNEKCSCKSYIDNQCGESNTSTNTNTNNNTNTNTNTNTTTEINTTVVFPSQNNYDTKFQQWNSETIYLQGNCVTNNGLNYYALWDNMKTDPTTQCPQVAPWKLIGNVCNEFSIPQISQ